jgi:hypothetical protein
MKSSQAVGVRWRSIIIGFLLIPINCYWIIQKTGVWLGPPDTLSLFYNVIFILLVLIFVNSLLRRLNRSLALTQGELLVIYIMLSISTALEGIDLMQLIPPSMSHAFWFATPENEWKELFWQYIPRWLTVSDKSVLRGYYEGDSTLYTTLNIKRWLVPSLWWSAFLMVIVFVMLCINVILRKQWTENEKLVYPIIQLPLEMTKEGNSFFRNKFLIIGFAVAGSIDFINGLHYLYPAIPFIPISRTGFSWGETFELGHFFTEKPFSAIGWTPVCVFPFAVGLTFLMPSDLSLSCWFFYFFRKIQLISGSLFGFQSMPGYPYIKPQASGAYIGFCMITLYQSRRYLISILRKAFVGDARIDDSSEPMPYRWAVLGIILGMTFLLLFSFKAGMSIWVAVIYFAIYFILSIAMTRMRAELGPPAHELEYGGPTEIITNFIGTRRLGAGNLTVSSLYMVFNRCYRSHPMPHQLEGFKLAEQTGIDNHKLIIAMLIAAAIGILSLFWVSLTAGYQTTGHVLTWAPQIAFDRLRGWLYNPRGSDVPASVFTSIGFSLTILLSIMRMRFIWWKLHPVGYPLCASWTINLIWFSILLGWIIKVIILKYGGIRGYRKALPFFLGLIMGEFIVGGFWNIIGQTFDVTTYIFWH